MVSNLTVAAAVVVVTAILFGSQRLANDLVSSLSAVPLKAAIDITLIPTTATTVAIWLAMLTISFVVNLLRSSL